MADETLEAALQHLLDQRNQIDAAIAAIQQILGGGAVAAPAQSPSGGHHFVARPSVPRGGEIVVHPGEFFQLSLTKATERILKRAGRPLKTGEILTTLRRAE